MVVIRKHLVIFQPEEGVNLPHLTIEVLEETLFGSRHREAYVKTNDLFDTIALLDEGYIEEFDGSEEAVSAAVMELVATAHTWVMDPGAASPPDGWEIVDGGTT